jgi:hypothetical protein
MFVQKFSKISRLFRSSTSVAFILHTTSLYCKFSVRYVHLIGLSPVWPTLFRVGRLRKLLVFGSISWVQFYANPNCTVRVLACDFYFVCCALSGKCCALAIFPSSKRVSHRRNCPYLSFMTNKYIYYSEFLLHKEMHSQNRCSRLSTHSVTGYAS